MTFSDHAIEYFTNLSAVSIQLGETKIINPYGNNEVKNIIVQFYSKFYNDKNERIYLLGINPGRFGGGLTGISFTDPVALREECGIENDLGNKKEISSEFIYKLIREYGGAEKFFSKYFLSALYPLTITRNGKNYNYYDDADLFKSIRVNIASSIKKQAAFGADRRIIISLGKKNGEYLNMFNKELKIFDKVITLDHPRFIMQYRRKSLNEYIDTFLQILSKIK